MPKVILPDQNLFSSLQFIDKEVETQKHQKAFKLVTEQATVAWASIYFLSPRVLRLCGLIVLPEYRHRKYMTILLLHIIRSWAGGSAHDDVELLRAIAAKGFIARHVFELGFRIIQ